MKAKIIGGIIAGMLALPQVAWAREVPAPDFKRDTRAPVTEQMTMRTADYSCSVGNDAGALLPLVGVGLVLARRRRR